MKRRFTLIELLVVISIIGILSSILLPSLAEAKMKSLSAVCISNLKQIGVANYAYSTDYDDRFPVGMWDKSGNGTPTQDDEEGYERGLMPFMDYAAEVFECPGFERSNYNGNYDRQSIDDPNGGEHKAYRTYRSNNFRYYNTPEGTDNRWKNGLVKFEFSLSFNEVANDTIMNGDYNRGVSYANFGRVGYWDRRGVSFGNHQNVSCNLLFVDGSARTFKSSIFLSNADFMLGNVNYTKEANSNNLGVFIANMAPIGSFWTVIDD